MRKALRLLGAPVTVVILLAGLDCSNDPQQLRSQPAELLARIRETAPSAARSVKQAPFMRTPRQGADVPALRSILETVSRQFPAPPVGPDTGDRETWRLAPYHQFRARYGAAAANRLLSPYQWQLETRRLAGARVGVLWPRGIDPHIPWTAIDRALAVNRRIAGTELPPQNGGAVVIVYGAPLHPRAQAESLPTHIAVRSGYGQDPETAAWILAHEVTHRWWSGNAPYVDEGMGELVAAIATGQSRPRNARTPCPARTIDTRSNRSPTYCDYQLGGLLMNRLRQAAGPERFRAATSELLAQASDGRPVTLQQLKQAFPQPEAQAIIAALEGTEP